jgi:hypothetical protein
MNNHYSFRTKYNIKKYLAKGESVTEFINEALRRHIAFIDDMCSDTIDDAFKRLERAVKSKRRGK